MRRSVSSMERLISFRTVSFKRTELFEEIGFAASAGQDVLFWIQSKWLSRGRPPNAVVRPFPPAFPAADLAPSSKRTAAGYRAAAAQTVEVL